MNYQNGPNLPIRRDPRNLPSHHMAFNEVSYLGDTDVNNDDQDGFDFWNAFRIINNRKWMILAVVMLGLVVATILSLRTTPLYKARSTIEIQKQEIQIIEGGSVDQPTIADAEYISTQFELLKSRVLAENVVESLDLASDERYADQSLPRDQRTLQAAETVVQNLRVSPVGRSRVIKVEFISPYAAETARITNALIDTFIQSNLERRYNNTAYAREFLEERLASTKSLLEEKERELVKYANEENILDLTSRDGRSESLDVNSVIALNQDLSQAESARIDAEQAYREAANNPNMREIVGNEALRTLRTQLAGLEAEYEQNLTIYQPNYPEMVRLQTRIDALGDLIAIETGAIVSALEGDYRAALAREESLRTRVAQLSSALQDERDRRINYTILQREVDTNRQQYEALLQRMKEISISSGIGTSQVSVIDEAIAPKFPFEPNLMRALLQAGLLSMLLGVGLAFALNYIDDTIKTPEQLSEKLGLPAIGLIPISKKKKLLISDELSNSKSPILEAYLSARTALDYATTEGAPKSLLITSTKPSEGKTSTALALATTYARNDKKVLIIDADMRKPSFFADPEDSIGLSGLLTNHDEVEPHLIETETDNVFLLPAGVVPPNPAELLASSRLRDIIEEMEDMFDVVVVDSPPVLSFADAPLLGAACESALVVLSAGSVRSPEALRTLARLYESRTIVLGAILSKFDAKHSGHNYNYYYSAYGQEEESGSGRKRKEDRRRIMLAKKADPEPEVNDADDEDEDELQTA